MSVEETTPIPTCFLTTLAGFGKERKEKLGLKDSFLLRFPPFLKRYLLSSRLILLFVVVVVVARSLSFFLLCGQIKQLAFLCNHTFGHQTKEVV